MAKKAVKTMAIIKYAARWKAFYSYYTVYQCSEHQEYQKGEAEWPAARTNFRTRLNDHLVFANIEKMRRGKHE